MKSLPVLRIRYAVLVDLLWIVLAYAASIFIRFEGIRSTGSHLIDYQNLLLLSLAIRIPVYALFGLYHRLWRYASARELTAIVAAATLSSVIIATVNFGVLPALGLPFAFSRSVVALDWLLNLLGLGGSRLALRLMQETASTRQRQLLSNVFVAKPRRVLVAGAGDAGAMIVRELKHNPGLGMLPVGFVDDDCRKHGLHVHGVRVLGNVNDTSELCRRQGVDEVIGAMPTVSGDVIRNLRQQCHKAGVRLRTMPGIYELLDGTASVGNLRDVRIEDLLRRKPVVTDQKGITSLFHDTRVLVTGAGGSIGSELCRQLAHYGPSELMVLGHGEFSIFNIQRELERDFPSLRVIPVIADIRDGERVGRIMEAFRPASVFHAAAHKHVPLMERNAEEAFTNNVLGTRNVVRAAERCGVGRFVQISTDKAVNPTSVMGATKRVAEILVHDTATRTGQPFVAVRFGNVLGSRGSAVPVFQQQIAAGGPVTITHPEMRRFFMTIPEAVQLVLQAATLGQGGETFLLDMGEPVKIVDLVNDLIELSGLTPGKDIHVTYTGLRPGEKLYEELSLASEEYGPTQHEKISLLRNGTIPVLTRESLDAHIDTIADSARGMRPDEVVAGLQRLVPEFGENRSLTLPGAATPGSVEQQESGAAGTATPAKQPNLRAGEHRYA